MVSLHTPIVALLACQRGVSGFSVGSPKGEGDTDNCEPNRLHHQNNARTLWTAKIEDAAFSYSGGTLTMTVTIAYLL